MSLLLVEQPWVHSHLSGCQQSSNVTDSFALIRYKVCIMRCLCRRWAFAAEPSCQSSSDINTSGFTPCCGLVQTNNTFDSSFDSSRSTATDLEWTHGCSTWTREKKLKKITVNQSRVSSHLEHDSQSYRKLDKYFLSCSRLRSQANPFQM